MNSSESPKHWSVVELDELRAAGPYTFVGGPFGSDLTQNDYVPDAGVPVIRGTNLGGKESRFVDEGFVFVSEAKADSLLRNTAFRGDLVFTQRGTLGQLAIIPEKSRFERYVISQSQMKLTPDSSRVDSRFLYQYFRTPRALSQLASKTLATGVPHINLGILKRFPVALPPLTEQRRIADVLDRAEALRTKRRAALAQLDTLTQSILLDLFGDPATNPRRWPVKKVSEYVDQLEGGKSLEAEAGENVVTQNRVLKISAVTGMKFIPSESKPVPDSYSPPPNHFVRRGDLLFSRANTTELVGSVALVDCDVANLLLPDKLWRFVWNRSAAAEPLFVWALFQTPTVRHELERRATGSSASMKNISQQKVFDVATIWPPADRQQDFALRIAAVEKLKSAQRTSLAELDALFASLQHRAFRGEL